jgi:hypothetical protein
MISDAYLRARIAEVQHEFAVARRWRRRLTRLIGIERYPSWSRRRVR